MRDVGIKPQDDWNGIYPNNILVSKLPNGFKVIASSTIVKKGKSIAFTRCELHQNDSLIAVSSATNKLINI